jgi:hypothetical protein
VAASRGACAGSTRGPHRPPSLSLPVKAVVNIQVSKSRREGTWSHIADGVNHVVNEIDKAARGHRVGDTCPTIFAMYIVNELTDDDFQRVHDTCPDPPSAMLIAGSFAALLEAIDIYTQETVHPVTSGMLALTDRQKVILGLYYRSVGFCRTAIELKSVIHQQSLTSAERSVIELYIDMELVHRNAIPDAVAKVIAFGDWQKLNAARRMDKFFTDNPALDEQPSKATVHRAYIASEEQRIIQRIAQLWGANAKPKYWSELNLIDRSKRLDKDAEYLVMKDYDRRNFYVHSGLVGVFNLSAQNFEQLCMFALNLIGGCMLNALKILGQELKFSKAIAGYDETMAALEQVQTLAFAYKVLQDQGAPQRYFIHKGEPPLGVPVH